MDYIGYSVYNRTFLGERFDLDSLNVTAEEPDGIISQMMAAADLMADKVATVAKRPLGATIHLCNIGEYLLDQFIADAWIETRKKKEFKHPFRPGYHINFDKGNLPLAPGFPATFKKAMADCAKLDIDACVMHAPMVETSDTDGDWIDLMLRDDIVDAMRGNKTILCWENAQDTPARYRLLKNLLGWRERLVAQLERAGCADLASRHVFCFDTGHFNLSLQRDGASKDEVTRYLPEFGKLVKVFHIQINDGTRDHHLLPFIGPATYLRNASKKDVDDKKLKKNSALVLKYLWTCDDNKQLDDRHVHIEIDGPFTIDEVVSFYARYYSRS
nr:hypothetical protein [Candidatus Sigynarchaeota archaeon]